MNKPLAIGISGLATCGKNLFSTLLQQQLHKEGITDVREYSLANQLKLDLSGFLLQKCGVNIFNCTSEQKEEVRDILVAYGKVKRVQTKGTYWTAIVEREIIRDSPRVAIINDIRYCFYPKDEAWWVKNQMNGLLVHIKKYVIHHYQCNPPVKFFIEAPNVDEKENDPKVDKLSDYHVIWEDSNKDYSRLNDHIKDFVQFLRINKYL